MYIYVCIYIHLHTLPTTSHHLRQREEIACKKDNSRFMILMKKPPIFSGRLPRGLALLFGDVVIRWSLFRNLGTDFRPSARVIKAVE